MKLVNSVNKTGALLRWSPACHQCFYRMFHGNLSQCTEVLRSSIQPAAKVEAFLSSSSSLNVEVEHIEPVIPPSTHTHKHTLLPPVFMVTNQPNFGGDLLRLRLSYVSFG